MSNLTTKFIGAFIGAAMFFAVGLSMAHAHTAPQQTGVVVYVDEP
jgi:hypothetical protein